MSKMQACVQYVRYLCLVMGAACAAYAASEAVHFNILA